MNQIAYIVAQLVRWLQRYLRAREQHESQATRDEIERDPAAYFNEHFNGVRDESAPATDETDATRDDKR